LLTVLEVLAVGKKTRLPDPLCIPAVEADAVNDAVDSVVPRGFGIPPLKVAATGHQRLAPVPDVNPLLQLAISEKFSVYDNPDWHDMITATGPVTVTVAIAESTPQTLVTL
jgi:hypothetical protein